MSAPESPESPEAPRSPEDVASESWDALVAIDRLEVGPPRVEPARVTTPYRIVRADQVDTVDLVYRWEESVFDPDDAASVGLAAFIGAQVALNYGLFCREIVLRGPFDAADRSFLTRALECTSREIAVKKLLQPNPFLVGDAAHLPTIHPERWTRAALVFPDPAPSTASAKPSDWTATPHRTAVLASGGKDSLLGQGLLEEIGEEVHAIFGNESGRHWYTAINAHRHLAETRPERTSRVWMTSDRVFSRMLRHLPFIRQDFANVRADDYPVRLWTVAVFLVGALPILRKRGIGRIVIGDEYDTTLRATHTGIPHYDGLYDQSRWFDDELTRYFRRKKWPLVQFSILRPLSEFLIQGLLAKRYPELWRQQVSCHAAHLEGERVVPCGRCEKCSRIVAMLLALGHDPATCGYTPERVRESLDRLRRQGLHQEAPVQQHLAFLLAEKGVLDRDGGGLGEPREHPEVESLRFHPERSPPGWIPVDLRSRLLPIYLEHARGALRRTGRTWSPVDPLTAPEFAAAYPFEAESPPPRKTAAKGELRGKRPWNLGELSWPEAKQRFRETDTALLPVGAIEQHGPHLPLDVDAWDAARLCELVAEQLSDPKPLVLPLIPYGVSYHHDEFAGTLSVSPEILARFVYEVGVSAARHGITKLIIVNGHGGNAPTLQLAAQLIHRDARIFVCVDTGETSDVDIEKISETPGDVHAGEIETSTTLSERPELVDMSRAERCVPDFSSEYLDFAESNSVDWYVATAKISPSGILGDATKASREKGERIWKIMVDHLVAFVERLKGLSLDEIQERRH